MIIGLAGYARAGKDTIGQILVEEFGYTRIAFADALKNLALKAHPQLAHTVRAVGWETAKQDLPEVRVLLQRLGVACREVLDDQVWVRVVESRLWADHSGMRSLGEANYVITDVRFPNEVEMIREHDGLVVRVIRPGTEPAHQHISDTLLDEFEYDEVIVNNGTIDDLGFYVRQLLETLNAAPDPAGSLVP